MKKPTVSVIMATYNHAPFVAQAIESVLSQQGVDFEFLIADDGSKDETRDVVATFKDARIQFFPYTVNRGACVVTNELIERSSGEFIALINSDDFWASTDKLAYQLEVLRENPALGACFGRARFVDRDGNPIESGELAFGSVFNQSNRTQGEWLRYFFTNGNCICHPTMMIRKSCYDELGLYSNRLRQLPDLDMWVRLVKRYQIYISERILINFRVLPGENAASQTPVNSIRTMNEHYLIAESFFDGVSLEVFIDGFSDLLKYRGPLTERHLEIEKTLLFFDFNQWLGRAYQLIGILKMRRLLDDKDFLTVIERDYQIGDHWFHQQMGQIDIIRSNFFAEISVKKGDFRRFVSRVFSKIFR